jgi:SAM-dependent methyltransferase
MSDSAVSGGQRTAEWDRLDEAALRYHHSQWETPKRSTLHFARFAAPQIATSRSVVDLGCGAGAATAQLARESPSCKFLGIDLSPDLIGTANTLARQRGVANLAFEVDDWYQLRERHDVDGVISLQTLSWLPEFEWPLQRIFERMSPRWIAISSLFYEGDISCRIEVTEHTRARQTFYNVYSLPAIDRCCRQQGYRVAGDQPFDIDVDLPRPENRDLMGTYTVRIRQDEAAQERLQISGPLLMNWRNVLIERT